MQIAIEEGFFFYVSASLFSLTFRLAYAIMIP